MAELAMGLQGCDDPPMQPIFPLSLFAIVGTLYGATARPGGEVLPSALMDTIEAKISASPCIGQLAKWDRTYSYKAWLEGRIYHLDTMAIVFRFAEAGRYEFRPGRRFTVDPPAPMIDDRSYKVAYGEIDLETQQVTITTCGSNMAAD